ncbi:serine hydrolase domain-containing protein [Agromyces sp. NPDC058110]|uniref:serine hydrolase domain-containing protein n=1 Tax=Agromyces sp. NPDC058110 TaxID=3346345 RepID=UPI0036D7B4A6
MDRAREIRDLIVHQVESTGFGAHGLHVRIGEHIAEHRWAPDVRTDIQSVAKGLCVLAACIAADDGLVDLDAPVTRYVPHIVLGEGVQLVTLRQLLTMTSGIDLPWSETLLTDWPDLAVEFLGRPSAGRQFQYSNASTYTAMFVLGEVVGDVGHYLDARVLEPLGIHGTVWERCPNGRIAAGGGIAMRTEEMARLGKLIRDGGAWSGTQLVSAHWAAAMHSDWVTAGEGDGYERYALAGWEGPGDGWRLHGAYGQMILFASDGVVTITADDHFGADAIAAFVINALAR